MNVVGRDLKLTTFLRLIRLNSPGRTRYPGATAIAILAMNQIYASSNRISINLKGPQLPANYPKKGGTPCEAPPSEGQPPGVYSSW